MPTSGLVLLVASTADDSFAPPTPAAFVSGDDMIVGRWDLSALHEPGQLLDLVTTNLQGAWTPGDPLLLYWFPSLTLSATAPGAAGLPYGTYRSNVATDGGESWITPSDGSTVSLRFLTSDSIVAGSNPALAGVALHRVQKQQATIALAELDHAFDGTPKTPKATTTPAGLRVVITSEARQPFINPGSYLVHATIDDFNYEGTTDGVLTIRAPAVPASPTFSITEDRRLHLRFFGIPNDTLVVQTTTNLINGPWISISTNLVSMDGSFSLTNLPMNSDREFFRVIRR